MKKKYIFFTAIATLLIALVSCNGGSVNTKLPTLKSELDSMNYAYGLFNGDQLRTMIAHDPDSTEFRADQMAKGIREGLNGELYDNPQLEQVGGQVGNWLKQQTKLGLLGDSTLKLNYPLVKQGLVNGIRGKKQLMSFEEAQEYLESTMSKREEEANKEKYGKNKEDGQKFLEQNAQKQGIVTTQTGLQYEVLKAGKGAKPSLTDEVKVDYVGTFIDGQVFDSSIQRGEPAVFGVDKVIAGWTEVLQLMPVGSKYRVYIPYNLAYGERGNPSIPPYSLLIFDVELLEIMK